MSSHLKVPFRIEGPRAQTVVDGSLDEIIQNVAVILSTRPGERMVAGEFGWDDPTFGLVQQSPDESEIVEVVGRWEERARLTFDKQILDAGEVNLQIRVGV